MRIVSLAPSITETVFAIGMGDKLVGRTDYCDYPNEVASVRSIGGFSNPDIDRILASGADIVIGTSMHQQFSCELSKYSIKTVMMESYAVFDAPVAISHIMTIVNADQNKKLLVQKLKNRLNRIQITCKNLPRKKVLYFCDVNCPAWDNCPISLSLSFVNAVSVGRNESFVNLKEQKMCSVANIDLDLIIIPENKSDENIRILSENGLLNKSENTALKKTIKIFDSNILGRPGPRAAIALEELAFAVHGEAFIRMINDNGTF